MANTFNAELMPRILGMALDVLTEEFAMAQVVSKDFDGLGAKIGDTVTVSVPVAQAITDVTPAAIPPNPIDSVPTIKQVTINKWKKSGFHMTEREVGQVLSSTFVPGQIAEGARALAKQLNSDLFANYVSFYGYAGTAGTNPFATTVNSAADTRDVLNRQLCPDGNRWLIIGQEEETAALQSADLKAMLNAGDANAMRRGDIGTLYGFDIKRDQQRPTHTAGTNNQAYLINNGAGYPAGTKTVTVDTGAGTIVVGDILSFAGVTGTYTVTTALAANVVSFEPGLAGAVADNAAITGKATHKVNLAFDPKAFALAMRVAPDSIEGAPTLGEHMVMTHPQSGLPMKLSYYPGYHLAQWELSIMYGSAVIDARRGARLAG